MEESDFGPPDPNREGPPHSAPPGHVWRWYPGEIRVNNGYVDVLGRKLYTQFGGWVAHPIPGWFVDPCDVI